MNNQFLTALRQRAAALRTKIHVVNNSGMPIDQATGHRTSAVPADLGDIEHDATNLLAFIEDEIRQPKTAAEWEAEARNTAPLSGETPAQTQYRLESQRAHNPLISHQVPHLAGR